MNLRPSPVFFRNPILREINIILVIRDLVRIFTSNMLLILWNQGKSHPREVGIQMLSRNLLGSFRSWPQTFLMHISDSVIPFNSSLQLLNHSGMRLSFMERNDFTIPISQFHHMHVSQENQALYLPTKSLTIPTYQSPILRSPPKYRLLELWHEYDCPREVLSLSSNPLSSHKTPNI